MLYRVHTYKVGGPRRIAYTDLSARKASEVVKSLRDEGFETIKRSQ